MGRENRISLLYQLQGPYKSQLQLHNTDDIGHYAPLHIRNTVKVGRTASAIPPSYRNIFCILMNYSLLEYACNICQYNKQPAIYQSYFGLSSKQLTQLQVQNVGRQCSWKLDQVITIIFNISVIILFIITVEFVHHGHE
jgi:hypothetical protein